MAFKKGKSGNPRGRPKGAKGKAPKALLERVKLLVDSNIDKLQNDLDALPPAERVRAIIKLLDFVLPKSNSVEVAAILEANPRIMTQAEAIDYLDQLNNNC